VATLLGPRQCGKTTLARLLAAEQGAQYFDLEHPADVRRLEQPMTALEPLRDLVVIDEIQRQPSLFPILRVLADRRPLPARFLVLGSASPDLIHSTSESLAGRVGFVEMSGFTLDEVGLPAQRQLWWRGGFPLSFLAEHDEASRQWRDNFMRTFLERDLRAFGVQIPAMALRRLWTMLAHYHGQVGNASEIARSLGVSPPTVRHHLDILAGAFMLRLLPPWFENVGKRQVKSPKVYVRDTGLLHELLGLDSFARLEAHPKLGASWEGFVLETILGVTGDRQAYFWATHGGHELDVLLLWRGQRVGVEIKYADAPAVTKSMRVALTDLRLDRLFLVYPGTQSYRIDERIETLALDNVTERLRQL
jgi:predicted AAA+ superfamily ATPase